MLIPEHIVQANDSLLYGLGLAASVVCAVTGVLVARDKGVDLFGALMAGIATSLGGGTVRDLLIGRKVFWIADETYLWVTVLAAGITFFITRVRHLPEISFSSPMPSVWRCLRWSAHRLPWTGICPGSQPVC